MSDPISRRSRRPKPALASRLILGGAAVGGGLAMVGAMASAAATEPAQPTPVIHRTVVVSSTPDDSVAITAAEVTRLPPAPPPSSQAPVAESGGS